MNLQTNLDIFNKGFNVPKDATKPFNNGRFKGTDINRMWRIKVLTDMFGPAGVGWDWQIVETSTHKLEQDDRVVIFAKGELKIWDYSTKMWSKPIIGYGGNDLVQSNKNGCRINDDAYKMVDTDAFGHACSKLGIGGSVYWDEGSKYTLEKAEDETNQGFVPKSKPYKITQDGEKADKDRKKQKDAILNDITAYYFEPDKCGAAADIINEELSNFGSDKLDNLNSERLQAILDRLRREVE